MSTKISIAMATYNGEKYLREQLDSILFQTISDFEVVVCDDKSNDGTVKILKEYAKKDKRIHFFVNESNLGFVKNFEKAISLCSGEYIALSDQDDIWTNDHLEVLLAALSNASENELLVCGLSKLVDKNGNFFNDERKLPRPAEKSTELSKIEKLIFIIFVHGLFQGATMMFKRELLCYSMPFPPNISFHDHYLSLVALSYNKAIHTRKVLTYYRCHDKTVTKHGIKKQYEKKSILTKIFKFKPFVITDDINSVYSCKSILQNCASLPQENEEILKFTVSFFENYKNRLYRWKSAKFYFERIFPAIYSSNALKKIKFIFRYLFL